MIRTASVVPHARTTNATPKLPLSTTNASIVAIATRLLKIGPTAGQKYLRCEFSTAEMTEPAPYRTTWIAKKRKKNVAAETTASD